MTVVGAGGRRAQAQGRAVEPADNLALHKLHVATVPARGSLRTAVVLVHPEGENFVRRRQILTLVSTPFARQSTSCRAASLEGGVDRDCQQ